ncbi:fibroblast growth factor 22 isoform X1 [Pipistrellus kuhlii]|uniref:fibroblast growth factor 22 isoform X1 n=1 Tax=Pipistrellus kuhlii TaxID=59472 RepID=UPI001E2744ED|nr:fibroblast growth factor 22 isoform X1 [Pipistrellus kuhlii]
MRCRLWLGLAWLLLARAPGAARTSSGLRRPRSYPHLEGDVRWRRLFSSTHFFLRVDPSGLVQGTRWCHSPDMTLCTSWSNVTSPLPGFWFGTAVLAGAQEAQPRVRRRRKTPTTCFSKLLLTPSQELRLPSPTMQLVCKNLPWRTELCTSPKGAAGPHPGPCSHAHLPRPQHSSFRVRSSLGLCISLKASKSACLSGSCSHMPQLSDPSFPLRSGSQVLGSFVQRYSQRTSSSECGLSHQTHLTARSLEAQEG